MGHLLATICAADIEGAMPIYTQLWENQTIFVMLKAYSQEIYQQIRKETDTYCLWKKKQEEDSRFQGFVAGTKYDEAENMEQETIIDDMIVVKDEGFWGCKIKGSNRSYHSEEESLT